MDGNKSGKELLGEVEELRRQLAAAERDHQIVVAGLREKHRMAESQWRQRVETLEAQLAGYASGRLPSLSSSQAETGVDEGDGERPRLLAMIQNQAQELQAANEELTIQAEELRISNEELSAQAEILELKYKELEQLSQEFETERALLTSVLEQMPAGVVIAAAPGGPILLSNKRAEELFRQSLGSLADAESFWRIPRYAPDGRAYRKEEMPLWRSLHLGEAVMDEEYSLRHQNGPPIHVSVSSAPVRDSQGRIVAGVITYFDITARKQAETALRESREDLNRAQAVALTGSWRIDVQHNELQWSKETYRIFGIPQGTLLTYEAFLAVVHPEDRAYVDQNWAAALLGEPYDIEHRIVVDDTVKWVREKAELELDPQGRLLGGFGAVQDITVRKANEQALRQERDFVTLLLETVGALVVVVDREGRIISFNYACEQTTGYSSREVQGKPIFDLFLVPEEIQGGKEVYKELSAGHFPNTHVNQWVTKDGNRRLISWSNSALTDEQGRVTYVIGTGIDITERQRAEAALRESEERYRSLFENNHTVMLLIDPESARIMDANPAACLYYGYSRQELLTQKITDRNILTPAEVFQKMQRAKSEQHNHFEFRHRLASGEIRDVEVFSGPIRIKGQKLLYSIVHDDTARKQAQEALKRAHQELEQRVQERTAELRDMVAQLIEEVQDRQQAQESLRKQAELLELAQEAIIVRDLDAHMTFWSRGAAETYGWTKEQALGRVTHTLLQTRFPTTREEVDQELLQTGHWQGKLVHTRANGEEIVVASRMALQRNERGKPVAILEINRDVTARLQAEEALKIERQRVLAVLERIPAHVALLRPDHTLAYVNGEFIRRFGEPGVRRCYEITGRQSTCAECQAMEVFHTGKPVVWEWTGTNGDIYQMYDYPFIDVDGSPLVLEMGVDITPRKRAEDQALSLGRMYRMLSKVNEAIVRVTDKEELFRQICRLMMEEGQFLLAWIGLVDRETRLVKAAAQYDLNDDYLQNITIPLDDVPEGRGPTGTAVREGRYSVCNDIATDPRLAPWREPALARGFQSSAALPLREGSQVVGALTVYADRPGFFTADETGLLESLADNLSFALEFQVRDAKRRRAEAALRASEERLRYLSSQLLHAQEKERRRLALELHDDLGQSLMVLKLQLRAIEKTVPPDQWKTREACARSLDYLNEVINSVRRLARNLRPAVLEDLGLSAGLRVLTEEFRAYHEIDISLETDDIDGLFSQDDEINIYRIFQETLTNIAKHAQATRVNLVITRQADCVTFKVMDDGVGFDLEQALARAPDKKGLGLAALEERVHMLRGTQTIRTQARQGTEVSFIVPIPKKISV
jgi:PAS domain S-box-containing protein